ncbi:MAG: hypothetical protein Q7K03_01320 [Dehalococcoidia bacterium]|nr:hypothetical protein [Dehalococcoidia bacterium]
MVERVFYHPGYGLMLLAKPGGTKSDMEQKSNKKTWAILGTAVAGLALLLWWTIAKRGKQPSAPKHQ